MIDPEAQRARLCALGDAIRDRVIAHRAEHGTAGLGKVVGRVTADVTYAIDRVGEDEVLAWLEANWPADEAVRLVMEGVEDDDEVVVPSGAEARWLLVVDPIDGTRGLMVDKRSAWVLTALAPIGPGGGARLPDVTVAAMTEIPTTRQWRADQASAVRGRGPAGVVATARDVRTGTTGPLRLSRSAATCLEHGFVSFTSALPDGKGLLATAAEHLLDLVVPPGPEPRQIFEDQYLCSGGQLYEVLAGRDRVVGDLRPLALVRLGLPVGLTAHPYDVCTALVLTEAGGVVEDPRGGPLDVPLDTTTPVVWVAYANEGLARLVRPALAEVIGARLST